MEEENRSVAIPVRKVGKIIGRDGVTIKWITEISKCSRCYVDTDHETTVFKEAWCHVRLTGTPTALYRATRAIIMLVSQ